MGYKQPKQAFFDAVFDRDEKLLWQLIESGADVNVVDKRGWTPLMATILPSPGFVPLLLRAGADPRQQNHDGFTALSLLVGDNRYATLQDVSDDTDDASGLVDIAQCLLDYGADPETRDKEGMTALIHAVRSPSVPFCRALLERGANIEAQSSKGTTPLMLAAGMRVWGHPDDNCCILIELLLDAGANVDAVDNRGYSAAIHAIQRGLDTHVDLLLKRGATILALSSLQNLRLILLAVTGDDEGIRQLLQSGETDLDARTTSQRTALMWAASRNDLNIVRLLLEAKVSVNLEDEDHWTALLHATYHGHQEMVRLLLEHGADVRAKGEYGAYKREPLTKNRHNALYFATKRRDAKLISLLLSAGVPLAESEGGVTMKDAAEARSRDLVHALWKAGESVEPWHAAAVGDIELLAEAVRSTPEDKMQIALHSTVYAAAGAGHISVLTFLDAHGLAQKVYAFAYSSALITAVRERHVEVVRWLLQAGASTIFVDRNGETAMDAALIDEDPEILDLLTTPVSRRH